MRRSQRALTERPFRAIFSLHARSRLAIRRGNYSSVRELNTKIRAYIDGWNDRCHRFVWTRTADGLLKKAKPQGHFKRGALALIRQ